MKYLILLIALSGCADKLSVINHNANLVKYVPGKYDCRSFVDAKYKALISEGYKDSDIKFVITAYENEPHVVLNVNGMILDNLREIPYPATRNLQNGLTYKTWNYYRTKGV